MSFPPALSHRPAPLRRAVLATVAALAAAPVVLGAAPAHAGPAGPEVPSTIDVVGDFKPYLVGHAVGWQVHTCVATETGYGWRFDGPDAVVYDDNGKALADHKPGPRWIARDDSSVVGAVVDRAVVSPTAIPWLLLRATPDPNGPADGRLSATTHIQRIATTGGLTPAASECTAAAASVPETRYVPYTADYVFWKAAGRS
ncbi:MAG TPA: DUF3455 domain-containing protein [Actinomycetes bacterium]|nr:DUF3455 domain-containing protein [Actinomycetes bacterium]